VRRLSADSVNSMLPSPKSARKTAIRAATPPGGGAPIPRLHPMMACDTAFRMIARRHLGNLAAHHETTCEGDPEALHQMRIALTHLRTAILFFSPMVADSERTRIRGELKWLNAHLGMMRDIDVAIERLKAINKRRPSAIPSYQAWIAKRADAHRHLAMALRSARYRLLIKSTSDWIEHGPWSITKGKKAARKRASPVAAYSLRQLTGWQRKLLKKSRKLAKMDTEKRHQLRLLNKKLCYSIESFEDLFPDKRFSRQQTALKHLRKAQRSLGQLNDDARGHALAAALEREGVPAPIQFLSDKREKRLIRTTAAAYRKLTAREQK
jgi:CHAD domain-containing protein